MRHHPRCLPHEFADRAGKTSGAGALRLVPVPRFVMPHGLDDGPAASIPRRKSVEMTAKVSFHLTFGFGDKSKAGAIAHECRERADAKGPRVPQRLEHTGPAAQLAQPGFTPGEMIGFLARRIDHELPDLGIPGEEGLGVIQRLGGHFPGVIDAHQGGGLTLFVGREGGVGLLSFSWR